MVDVARLRARDPTMLLTVAAVVCAGLVGFVGARDPGLGFILLFALLMLFVAIGRPVSLAMLAVIGCFVGQRLGGTGQGEGGVSVTDAALGLAAFAAVPAIVGSDALRRLKLALAAGAVYLFALLPGVITHFSPRTATEWAHRLVLVCGALVVGAWLVHEGLVKVTLRALTLMACIVALFSAAYSVSHGFAPAYPIGLHKNFVGAQLASVLVILVAAPVDTALPRKIWLAAVILVSLGLLAAQSRGAWLGAALGLLLVFTIGGRVHGQRGKMVAVLVGVMVAVLAFLSLKDQQTSGPKSEVNNTSYGVRQNVERVTREIWQSSPIYGVGLKYFSTGQYGYFGIASTNAEDNELAESGLIGLAGFLAFQAGAFRAGFLRREDSALAVAGTAAVAARFLHGQFDVYWNAGIVPLAFLTLGIGLATGRAPERVRRRDGQPQTGRHRTLAAAST